jgi:hypothetical protein
MQVLDTVDLDAIRALHQRIVQANPGTTIIPQQADLRLNKTVSNATPNVGDTVTFTEPEIVDWMYMDGGRMLGNYSARAMLKSALPQDREAFRRRFGLDFDFPSGVAHFERFGLARRDGRLRSEPDFACRFKGRARFRQGRRGPDSRARRYDGLRAVERRRSVGGPLRRALPFSI